MPVEGDADALAQLGAARTRAGERVLRPHLGSVRADERDATGALHDPGDPVPPPDVDQRLRRDPLVEDLLGARLREVDEGWERRATGFGEGEREQLGAAVEGAGRRPG